MDSVTSFSYPSRAFVKLTVKGQVFFSVDKVHFLNTFSKSGHQKDLVFEREEIEFSIF